MRPLLPRRRVWLLALLLALVASGAQAGAPHGPRILALGNTDFLDAASVKAATGAELVQDPQDQALGTFTVIILADVAFASLSPAVQQGLSEYVGAGGAVWLTGGARGFGSGGYQPVAGILPFTLRGTNDWRPTPFRPVVVLQPGHPAVAGVDFGTVGAVNDMSPRSGAMEILQVAGVGGGTTRGGSYPYPLMAEIGIGSGRVVGLAFDLNDSGVVRNRDRFVENVLLYLVRASSMGR